jgi:peptide/nickel transport system substrate-binding protein
MMKKSPSRILCTLFLATPLLLASFHSSQALAQADGSGGGANVASLPDELIIATGHADVGTFDPKKGWGNHFQSPLTHSTLLAIDKDFNYVGYLAKSYVVSDNALEWTFDLRDDIKFSNGETVTPSDVKFTYEMLREDGIAFDLSSIKDIQLVGNNKIKFILNSPNSNLIGPLLEVGIVPEKYYNDNYSANPISSGPYQVVQYNSGQQIILEANPYWYGPKLHFKKLTLLLMDEDAALATAKAGQADVVYVPATFGNQTVPGMKMLEFKSVSGRAITMPTVPAGGKGLVNGVEVKAGNDVTSDVAIRRALSYGIDRQQVIDLALHGFGEKAFSLNDDLPWFNKETVIKDGDIDTAKKILSDAGWVDSDKDGIVEKNGLKANTVRLR